jgi:DNA-binding MarR family transcriptional regulator
MEQEMAVAALAPQPAGKDHLPTTDPGPAMVPYDLIELFFFAYRDFVSGPDLLLAEYGFGRAHHRVLHFVARNPGLTIAELLDILKITKQSLNRVMKDLTETGFIASRTGRADRRQRHLAVTAEGKALAERLAGWQAERINAAMARIPMSERAAVAGFLSAMIDETERDGVLARIAAGGCPR